MILRDSSLNRRRVLSLLGGALVTLAGTRSSGADQTLARLIEEGRDIKPLSVRLAFISAALRGKRYRAETLVGGPRKAEVFVSRDDVFDCVTYTEAVLAAARSNNLAQFQEELRKVRYHNGVVSWHERNHDFAAWCARNVENGLCKPVTLGTPVTLTKVMTYPRTLGRRTYEIAAISRDALVADKASLQDGDVIGFVSRRATLDYFHCGLVMTDFTGEVMLRHASQSRGRVIDQPLQSFLAVNRTQYVTLLRPVEAGEER